MIRYVIIEWTPPLRETNPHFIIWFVTIQSQPASDLIAAFVFTLMGPYVINEGIVDVKRLKYQTSHYDSYIWLHCLETKSFINIW